LAAIPTVANVKLPNRIIMATVDGAMPSKGSTSNLNRGSGDTDTNVGDVRVAIGFAKLDIPSLELIGRVCWFEDV
jgi:hypothetical protein